MDSGIKGCTKAWSRANIIIMNTFTKMIVVLLLMTTQTWAFSTMTSKVRRSEAFQQHFSHSLSHHSHGITSVPNPSMYHDRRRRHEIGTLDARLGVDPLFSTKQPVSDYGSMTMNHIHVDGSDDNSSFDQLIPHDSSLSTSSAENDSFPIFKKCLAQMSLPPAKQVELLDDMKSMGFTSCSELYLLSLDFAQRPEALSTVLRDDFGLNVGKSHLVRGALMRLVSAMNEFDSNTNSDRNDFVKIATNNLNSIENQTADIYPAREILSDSNGTSMLEEQLIPKDGKIRSVNMSADDNTLATNSDTGPFLPKMFETEISAEESQNEVSEKKSKIKKPLFKSVVVNPRAKQRHTPINTHASDKNVQTSHSYGLPKNCTKSHPVLHRELEDFLLFMTLPNASFASQESPIRKTTATVYIRHAKLFLGWYIGTNQHDNNHRKDDKMASKSEDSRHSSEDSKYVDSKGLISIRDIIPNKEATSAQPIIDFILWLRHTRQISDSYEANMLRGLTKLLKYRFRDESTADPSYGEKSFGDIPVVRELRKLHRDANRRQILSPRSSEEDRKWLDWEEYLNVVTLLKRDLENEISKFDSEDIKGKGEKKAYKKTCDRVDDATVLYTPTHRRIATKFQAYLILAFFSCVPDRQRTFRELEVGRSFIKDERINCWTIKHGPDDYKTGKTYGDRPPLVLAPELTPAIDDFLRRWRQCLLPSGEHFFVQPRTGKAFTQDSVYSLVARSCYKHTGKKTNPHLLRDMIVTHVRDSNASEKELEALALYMGHSISMQRSSYDRRTMEQKVAPAVELLRNVNTVDKHRENVKD